MNHSGIRIEGGLLSPDFLETIHDAPGQRPADFGLGRRVSLIDSVTAAWSDARSFWDTFQRRLARAQSQGPGRGESVTTLTREQWVIPLLRELLGYDDLIFQRRAAEIDGRTYAISHWAWEGMTNDELRMTNEETSSELVSRTSSLVSGPPLIGPPIHITGIDQELGDRPAAGRGRQSAHAMVQDYLNRTDDHLWGIVTNGAVLRLLRDSTYFTRPAYIEFDLRAILEGERLDEFFLLYRLAHRSRLGAAGDDPEQCLLEQYHRQTVEQGGRIRDGLRAAVSEAITTLGNGFLRHPRNEALRAALAGDRLSADAYYSQLLYLIYRLLFLMVAEERGLLEITNDELRITNEESRASAPMTGYYREHFSISRLRRLAAEALPAPERFDDLYLGLRTLFTAFHDERMAALLGVPALNGELFSDDKTAHLSAAWLSNRDLLAAVDQLSHFSPKDERVRRRVNYAALDVEELGSVYESLLDERPSIVGVGLKPAPTFALVGGLERKTTGSYYTPRELVAEVIKSALDPVIAARVAETNTKYEIRNTSEESASSNSYLVSRISYLEQALLGLRVIDPACGSGHFLLAAARRIGLALARARTESDEPPPEAVRAATRDAVTHCLYGVDKNPLAVDLCKVALWIEGHSEGKPLTFLDYKIRCGDSLVGVFDLDALREGIPDDAYKPLTGDDKPTAAALRKRNKQERGEPGERGQLSLSFGGTTDDGPRPTDWAALAEWPEDTPEQVQRKQAEYNRLHAEEDEKRLAADLWTAAFFTPLTRANAAADLTPTSDAVRRAAAGDPVNPALAGHAEATAAAQRFFHWPLEFPHVFGDGGFDVVLGNPPWEKTKIEEVQYFAPYDPAIAGAANKAERQKLIDILPQTNPSLAMRFAEDKRSAEAISNFVRKGGRFPLSGKGDVNTFALFTELTRLLRHPQGRVGLIIPTGLVSLDTYKGFFKDLIDRRELASFIGFINSRKIFPAIKDYIQFALLNLGSATDTEFAFLLKSVDQINDSVRRFNLTEEEFGLINPNTYTCPIFRTRYDAELTKKIYRRVPVLENERTGENPWGVKFQTLFHMSNDSHLFRDTKYEIRDTSSGTTPPHPQSPTPLLPLYEAKMMHQFDHRFGTYEGATQENINEGNLPQTTAAQKANPLFRAQPQYWVESTEVEARLRGWQRDWLLSFRDVTGAGSERTAIFSLLPRVGVGNNAPIMLLGHKFDAPLTACLLANTCCLVFDYVTRHKVGGAHMNFFIVKQLPVLPPTRYAAHDLRFIVPRVLELVYTSWYMAPFAADVWAEADEELRGTIRNYELGIRNDERAMRGAAPELATPPPFPPFVWDDARRARLRAELDAYYARLYGLTRDELRYILDPADVHGPDFPGETFRVLKEKEMKAYGEYRTGRLVLEAWDKGSYE